MTTQPDNLALMDGRSAPPRDNGELVFDAPWQARALALALAVVENAELPWDAFRSRLIEAIADAPERPYYESWAAALEYLVVSSGMATPADLDAATPTERSPL